MATFQIATPGGFEVEVRADNEADAVAKARENWQTMPRIIAKGADNTRVFERPNGQRFVVSPGFSTTDPQRVEQVLSGLSAGQASRQAIDESIIAQNPIAARANEVVRGTPFVGSFADEAVGAVAGPEAAAGMRAMSGAMQRQNPGQTLGLNLAGGLLGGAGMAAAAPAGVTGAIGSAIGQGSRLSRIGRGAAVGAGLGAAEGAAFGAGEGTDAASRGQAAGQGAAFGGTFGGLLGGAAPALRDATENVISGLRRSDIGAISKTLGISTDAAKVIKNTFDQGGDIAQAQAALQRAGSEAMLADAGQAAQALLDASATSGGRAGEIARSAIDQRMSRTSGALDATLDSTLGAAPDGPRAAVEAIAARSAPQRAEAYTRAFQTPINYGTGQSGEGVLSVINRVPPRILSEAIQEANEDMLARNMPRNMQILANIADDGTVSFSQLPNVQQLDELKKALQSLAFNNTDDFGRLNSRGQRFNTLARELRNAVGEAVPDYLEAVRLGGDKLAEERAFTLGSKLLRPGTEVEEVLLELGDTPSIAQLDAAKAGLRSHIQKTLGNVRSIASETNPDALEARQVIKAVTDMSSDNAREKMRRLLGPEADTLFAQIDEAAQSANVRAAMAVNSKTAPRQAIMETVEGITEPGALGQLAQGEAVGTTKAMIRAITGQTAEFTEQRKQKLFQDISRALTEKTGDEARLALRALDQAMKGQALTDDQTTELARLITTAFAAPAATTATRGRLSEERQGAR